MNKRTSLVIVFLLLIAAFLVGSTIARVRYGGGQETAGGSQTPTQPSDSGSF